MEIKDYYINNDINLEVYSEIPDKDEILSKFTIIKGGYDKSAIFYHHCEHCNGYIKGQPIMKSEHTMSILSGRNGTTYYCKRCGNQIAFLGWMA
jgi:hypothetical protein